MLNIPGSYRYDGQRLSRCLSDGTEVFSCNFLPKVLSASAVSAEATGDPYVEFSLCIDGQTCGPVRKLQLSAFKKTDLEALDIRCQSQGDTRQLPLAMYQIARGQLGVEDVCVLPLFTETGWSR